MPPQFTFQLAAHSYFRSYQNYFWQWEEQGTIIGIPNGRTIAYTPFVAETLGYLKEQGLPRLGTLLLTILATSRNAEADISSIITGLKNDFPQLTPQELEAIHCGEQFLLELANLPQGYKEGTKRSLTLQTIFKSIQHPIRHFFADDIVRLISKNRFNKEHLLQKDPLDAKTIYSDFHPFIQLRKDYPDAASIVKAMGELPEIEEELPIPGEKTEPEPAGDFLQELRQNPNTANIASLIPLIWSALEIPLHNRQPGPQLMGGVAGLTNKGEAHRLLVSEFANDDLVFLSRLANSEALYLNRETPPQSDNRERVLLVDVSLKTWGTPHIVAFALMLAIARHPKSDIPCSAFAMHEGWQPLRFDDIHQVVEGLLALQPCLHPAEGIERFFRENPEKLKAEVFLLTTAGALSLPPMQQAMAKFQPALAYWLLSDHEGRVDLYKKRGKGRHHVKNFQLPIGQFWNKKRRALQKEKEPKKDLIRTYYQLLFPRPVKIKALLSAGGKVYAVTGDHALMCKAANHSKYWEMLYENIPRPADHFEMGLMKTGNPAFLAFSSQSKEGFILDIISGEKITFVFNEWNPKTHKGFVFYGDRFYCPGREAAICWSLMEESPMAIGGADATLHARIHELLERKINHAAELQQNLPFSGKILRNIDRVWINVKRNLVFNSHELYLKNNELFMAPLRGKLEPLCVAEGEANNKFTFPDGSQVITHPAGMLILRSNERIIPIIFISSVVEKSLCLVAGRSFCGNPKFLNPEFELQREESPSFITQYLEPFIQKCLR